MELTKREASAYAAAMMDAEGVFNISMNKQNSGRDHYVPSYSGRVIVGMTDTGSVNLLFKYWGGKVVKRDSPSHHLRGRKPMFYWRLIEKAKLVIFIKDILPFLQIKKPQAELMLDFIKECKPIIPRKGVKGVPRMTDEELVLRQMYHHRMKVLNSTHP
jgi:hypothetical protein